ncbi:hypothetical protein [Streptomyces chumphonensis]|uniref:phage tail tube protein n=1 Tax=Streptomyces chumphonensis TaxID=1214925 RepID=UPI003D74D11D
MSLDDAAVLKPGTGYIYLAAPDTEKPDVVDPLDPGGDWTNLGHTSLENGVEFGRDGDDPEPLGSWQTPVLRETDPSVTYSLTMNALQASPTIYQLYFGGGPEQMQADGSFRIPARPTPQVKALLLVVVDGSAFLPLWHPRVSILGSDAVTLDPTTLAEFPIRARFLGSSLLDGDLGEWAVLSTSVSS